MTHSFSMLATLLRRSARGLLVLCACFLGSASVHAWHTVDLAAHDDEAVCEVCLRLASHDSAAPATPHAEIVVTHDAFLAASPRLTLVRAVPGGAAIRAPPF